MDARQGRAQGKPGRLIGSPAVATGASPVGCMSRARNPPSPADGSGRELLGKFGVLQFGEIRLAASPENRAACEKSAPVCRRLFYRARKLSYNAAIATARGQPCTLFNGAGAMGSSVKSPSESEPSPGDGIANRGSAPGTGIEHPRPARRRDTGQESERPLCSSPSRQRFQGTRDQRATLPYAGACRSKCRAAARSGRGHTRARLSRVPMPSIHLEAQEHARRLHRPE
jgi:hypothetical protein